ncbi:MAG: hypothetical protein JSS66_06360 [Armatimonadetes bacterium]|nr:hypothetical protein [Armatimonadota bacterium]
MSLVLRGTNFGKAFNGAGARGFFGHGNPFQKNVRVDWSGATFVSKSVTRYPNTGNPDAFETLPDGGLVNAVALDNPGLDQLLSEGTWQALRQPFVISLGFAGTEDWQHLKDAEAMSTLLQRHRSYFQAPFAVELNVQCPNKRYVSEKVLSRLTLALQPLDVPVIVKVGLHNTVDEVCNMLYGCVFDALNIGNSVRWGSKNVNYDWSESSGLEGAVSGARCLFDRLLALVTELRPRIDIPLCANGGVSTVEDIEQLAAAGADAVAFWSVSYHHPDRVPALVAKAKQVF